MPRATPIARSEIHERWKTRQVDPCLIAELAQRAKVPDAARERFSKSLRCAIWVYRVRVLANSQERPARIVAALRRGRGRTKRLLEWLKSIPDGLRLELRQGDIEELIDDLAVLLDALSSNIEERSVYSQNHVWKHRPAGGADAGLCLRQSLIVLMDEVHPDVSERTRRAWVAGAVKLVGAKYPNEKKNRARFTGEGVGKRGAAFSSKRAKRPHGREANKARTRTT
jgi:hypothetical protein